MSLPRRATPQLQAVTGTQAVVRAIANRVAAADGFPRPGRRVGGGIHVPVAQARTTGVFLAVKHPTTTTWAILVRPALAARLQAGENLQTLDATWRDSGGKPAIT